MNRIDQKFKDLKHSRRKAFIAFITAGDPNLKTTGELVLGLERGGVDVVELGVPFSDPLADGPTIQVSSQRSLKNGTNLQKILNTVKYLRQRTEIPIALMTYYNPVYHFGEARFIHQAKKSGVDGLIIPDLPPEEGKTLIRAARENGLSTAFFIAPTTTNKRMKTIIKASSGFIYYVALTGVTGAKKGFSKANSGKIAAVRRLTKLPVCVGFGISSPKQVKSIARLADGVIVGSAFIKRFEKSRGKKDLVRNITRYARTMSKALR